MTATLLNAYGWHWITKPSDWDDEHFPCESLNVPNMGTFIKLKAYISTILEIPYEWIYKVNPSEDTKYLDIIFNKEAMDTDKLTSTIIMCDNRWGPCKVGLYSECSDDEYGYESVYLKVSIKL